MNEQLVLQQLISAVIVIILINCLLAASQSSLLHQQLLITRWSATHFYCIDTKKTVFYSVLFDLETCLQFPKILEIY